MTTTDAPIPSLSASEPDPATAEGPWPGPVAYTEQMERVFIGREYETAQLVSLIHAYNLVLLHAPSGSGKTSLVNAAVIPQLRRSGVSILGRARVLPVADPERSDVIDRDDSEPQPLGPNPYEIAAIQSLDLDDPNVDGLGLEDLLVRKASELDADGSLQPLLVVFDQFEEILNYCDHYEDQQEHFMQAVQAAIDVRPNLRALFVVRDDHLGPVLRLGRSLREGFNAQMHLDRLGADAARRVLTEPLERFGKSITEPLVERVVEQASRERYVVELESGHYDSRDTTTRHVGLLTLQVVAKTLWHAANDSDVIKKSHLKAVGRVSGALQTYYDESVRWAAFEAAEAEKPSRLQRLKPGTPESDRPDRQADHERRIRAFFEKQLISSHDQRHLVPAANAEAAIGQPALRKLESHSIVRRLVHGPAYYELCHDSFVEPIRDSNRRRRQQRRRNRTRTIAATGAAVGAVAASIIVWQVVDEPTDEQTTALVAVQAVDLEPAAPDLVGMTSQLAAAEIDRRGLTVEIREVISELPEGSVLTQDPASGNNPPDGIVRLEVSAGERLLARDDSTVIAPGVVADLDVLANDETPFGSSDDLRLIAVESDPELDVTIVANQLRVLGEEPGDFAVTYRATNGREEATGNVAIQIEALEAVLIASATEVSVGETLSLISDTATATSATWSFGDGTTADGNIVEHRYEQPGTYTVRLAIEGATGDRTETSVDIVVLGSTRIVAVLPTDVNLRSRPSLSEGEIVEAVTEVEGMEIEVRREPTNGWYEIASRSHEDLWIFGSLILPQHGDLRVAVTLDGAAPEITDESGEAVDDPATTGRFLLVTGETETTFEVLLPDGLRGFVARADVALAQADVSVAEQPVIEPVG